MLNSDSPRPCLIRRTDFFESSFEEARIDRLRIGWPTFGERRSIKERVGNCGRVFPVGPCVLHRIELLFQWYSHWCAKKNAIEYLPSNAPRGRRSAAASLLARMDYSSLCEGAIIICLCCLAMSVLSHVLFKR